jgi:hypothetical protein
MMRAQKIYTRIICPLRAPSATVYNVLGCLFNWHKGTRRLRVDDELSTPIIADSCWHRPLLRLSLRCDIADLSTTQNC